MKEVTITLNLERETKRTRRFQEVGSDQCVGYLYVQKSCLERIGNPDVIEVTIRSNTEE